MKRRGLTEIGATITPCPVAPELLTHELFSSPSPIQGSSPVDEFLGRLESLNKLAPMPNNFDPVLGQLVLLGAMAAVESYLRAAFRKTINCDEESMECAYGHDISFAAAVHLEGDLLPEAILERITFVGKRNILETLKDLIGLQGKTPADLEMATSSYQLVCQLRHCAVHRFGRLGAQNALALGMKEHSALLERPMVLTYKTLQESIAICEGLVRSVNNTLFRIVVGRVDPSKCTGNYARDRKWFAPIYKLFGATVGSRRSPAAKDLYRECANALLAESRQNKRAHRS